MMDKRDSLKDLVDIKLLRFCIVGLINTFIGMAIMFGLYNLAGWSYWLSTLTNYVLTSILSYVLNKKFTFGHKGDVAGSAIRFAVNIAVCYVIAYGVAKPLMYSLLSGHTVKLRENAAMLVGMVLFTGLNYIGQRSFAFRDSQTERR